MSKNQKPWSAANISKNNNWKAGRTILEIAVDAAARSTVFYTCPVSCDDLMAMHMPVYTHREVVRWEWATVLEEDFFRMTREDYCPFWTKTDDSPVEAYDMVEDEYVSVARHILGADESDNVTYLDGNCFNLRRDNLAIAKQMAPAAASPRSKGGASKPAKVTSEKSTPH
jgi:hypothetical protein